MILSTSARRIADIIKAALETQVITSSQYEAIVNIAHEDGHIDRQEQAVLSQLHRIISEGSLRRVPDCYGVTC
ncbi:MAG: hypothetical protein JXA20_16705 [Spirochaetes bacterium]|nr:hypothetical protein [Spirochaetota bacterium]